MHRIVVDQGVLVWTFRNELYDVSMAAHRFFYVYKISHVGCIHKSQIAECVDVRRFVSVLMVMDVQHKVLM